jgi:putative addiction module killer protein
MAVFPYIEERLAFGVCFVKVIMLKEVKKKFWPGMRPLDSRSVVVYKLQPVQTMPEIKKTAEFDRWLDGLRDTRAKAKILVRIQRLAAGNPGDVAPVGDGVSEMRIGYGPGYRAYYRQKGDTAIFLFGGDKDSQQTDISKAKTIAKNLED